MEREKQKFRILMFPWLAHGHIFPFLELSKRLLETESFTIYLCSTAINLDSIRATLASDTSSIAASVELVELHMPSSPQLPPELHTTKNLPPDLLSTLVKAFQESSSSFSEIMDSVKPDLLIYDYFQAWAPKLASTKGIPSVYFLTSAATTFAYYHHVYTMGTGATFPFKAISLPDSDVIKLRNRIQSNVKTTEFANGSFTRSSDIVLVKSSSEIEFKCIEYLSALSKRKMVCTGPLIVDDYDCNDNQSLEIMKWLSSKNRSSTLYISFGSECFPSRDQIAEIAKGLLLCDVNFLWVMRFPVGAKITSMEEELPQGFLETVKDRGLVVSTWAPQTKILGHGSIGGFVSHCGWSSVVETMYFGVPVIALPMNADQPLNAQVVVESGIGVGVEKDGNGLYVGEEVAKAINKVMVEKASYEGLRSKARRLSEAIKGKDGHEVNEAAEELALICMKNKKISVTD